MFVTYCIPKSVAGFACYVADLFTKQLGKHLHTTFNFVKFRHRKVYVSFKGFLDLFKKLFFRIVKLVEMATDEYVKLIYCALANKFKKISRERRLSIYISGLCIVVSST